MLRSVRFRPDNSICSHNVDRQKVPFLPTYLPKFPPVVIFDARLYKSFSRICKKSVKVLIIINIFKKVVEFKVIKKTTTEKAPQIESFCVNLKYNFQCTLLRLNESLEL